MDPLRLVILLISLVLACSFIYTGVGLGGVRQYNCYCSASAFLVFLSGSYQRLRQAPTFSTWLTILPIVAGVTYLVFVHSNPRWREKP